MPSPSRSLVARYGVGLLVAGAAGSSAWLVSDRIPELPSLAILAAVALSAWLLGAGPALAALGLGLLLTRLERILTAPETLLSPREMTSAALVAAIGSMIASGAALAQRRIRRAQAESLRVQRLADEARKQHESVRATLRRVEGIVQEAHRSRNEFLAMLAHEMRNPLAPIRNALYILGLPETSAGTIAKVRDMLDRQVRHLTHLVDDLLDVTRMHGGKLELRKELVSLDVIVQQSLVLLRPLVEDRCLELSVSLPEEPILLEADPARLEQVLVNLLHNAIKYTDAGGRVWFSARPSGKDVEISVRDNGIGIAPEMLPDIFDLFVQMERRLYRSQGGLGIGLTLVRNLVELHGGTVQARSAGLGQGSEFVVRLPAREELPAASPPRVRRKDGKAMEQKLNLLVVDDNVDAADSLAILLRLEGHEVRVAHDGPAALKIAQSEPPQLILLDLGMPGMDGYQVARRLRRQPELHDVLLVALTGWGQEEDQRRTREAGFDLHLVKPVEPDALKELLANPPRPVAVVS